MSDARLTYDEFVAAMGALQEIMSPQGEGWCIPIAPYVWNGYWFIHEESRFLRRLGRFLHNKYIYALGLHVEWVRGLKDYAEEVE